MLHILTLLLKIIGIVLAVIIGIILFAFLLILFVPVRYRIKGEAKLGWEDPLYVEIKIRWLLRIVSLSFLYPKAAYLRVRIFGITIFNSSKPRKEKRDRKKEDKSDAYFDNKNSENTNESESVAIKEKETLVLEEKKNFDEVKKDDKEEKIEKKLTIFDKIKNVWNKILAILRNIKYTIMAFCGKIKKIIDNISYYLEIVQSDVFKAAFQVSRNQIFRIFKNICPQKCDIRLLLGTGDPASTGQILAIYGMVYPWIGNNVIINADFENKIAEGEFYIKGRVTAIVILISAFRIYRDKNIRHLLKLLKREDI